MRSPAVEARAPSLGARKLAQAQSLLAEHDLDAWMTVVRESSERPDPVLRFFLDVDFTWTTFFVVTQRSAVALVAVHDAPDVVSARIFDDVRTYKEGPKAALLQILDAAAPGRIGINVSEDDALADGLTAGLRDYLQTTLAGTPHASRLTPAGDFVAHLRAVKLDEERDRVARAVEKTEAIFDAIRDSLAIGITAREIAARAHAEADRLGTRTAWPRRHCPTVTVGPHAAVGHVAPGEEKITPGCVVHVDFGIVLDGYCSDLQRLWYVAAGSADVPPEVKKAHAAVVGAIESAAQALRPGVPGWQVDQVARAHLVSQGIPEYGHALGHHLGRAVHDGGGVLGPRWERYGKEPMEPVRVGNVFTLEPSVYVEGHGLVSLEEDVVVGPDGARFLSRFPRQLPILRLA
ncbi:MAG TPA: Xaa-Pro peptidase family protein [Candidatus Limnocylindrales bacterium]|nr:Xaa-Pro peptidase family protein [Candidatus Limnocylindrales bacterium]